MIPTPIAIINGLVCAAVCLRLLTYQRNGSPHKPMISWLAYMLIVASGGEAIMSLTGAETYVSITQLAISIGMAVAVFAHRGNVSKCLSIKKAKAEVIDHCQRFSWWGW